MKATRLRLGSIDEEIYVHAGDLAQLLKITDYDVSRLVRLEVITRFPDPENRKQFVYPVFESVTKVVTYRLGKREEIHQRFLKEKTGRERAARLKIETFNRQQNGGLVDKAKLIGRLEPIIAAFREQLLARAERLERSVSQIKSRKEKVKRIRAADLDALGVLSDLFKVASVEDNSNGATR